MKYRVLAFAFVYFFKFRINDLFFTAGGVLCP
jgi:hypothetical protein